MSRPAYFEAIHVIDSVPEVWLLMLRQPDGKFTEVYRWASEPSTEEIGDKCAENCRLIGEANYEGEKTKRLDWR